MLNYNISYISEDTVLRWAAEIVKEKGYFTIFDLILKWSERHNTNFKGNKLSRINAKRRKIKLISHLDHIISQLITKGFLKSDVNELTRIEEHGKNYGLVQFSFTKNGGDYITTKNLDFEIIFKWHKENFINIYLLEPSILVKFRNLFRNTLARLRNIRIKETQFIRQHQDLVKHHYKNRNWNACADTCISLSKEYGKLQQFDNALKYLISALYFNWLEKARNSLSNAALIGLALKTFKKGRLRKSLCYFKNVHLEHLPLEDINRFALIYARIGEVYANLAKLHEASEYYLLSRKLYAHSQNWSTVSYLDNKIKNL